MQNLDLTDLNDPSTKIEALRTLKERGIKLGKPKGTIQKSIFDFYLSKIKEYCRIGLSYGRQARLLKLSKAGIARYVKTRKIYRNPCMRR